MIRSLLLVVFLVFAFAPVAMAADCNFETAVDAKVVRFAWPPAIGLNLAFVDFEVGKAPEGMFTVCGNATVNVLAGICMIPRVGDVLGPLCSSD